VGLSETYSKKYVDRHASIQLAFFAKFFSVSVKNMRASWRDYVTNFAFQPPDSTMSFWMRVRVLEAEYPGFPDPVSLQPLGEMGMILAILPVSESSVERQFSHLRFILGTRAQHMSADLLDARIVMQLNDLHRDQSWNKVLDALQLVEAVMGPGVPSQESFVVPVPERRRFDHPRFGQGQISSMLQGFRPGNH
jgi:hypothetical protein